jgi:WD40 repeat protein
LTPEELTKLPSPLDGLTREAMGLPEGAPPEMIAVLGEFPRFAMPERTDTHWMAQTGDGRLLAVPCGRNIMLFEARTGRLLRTATGHTRTAYRPAFSADGKRLASGSEDFSVRVWDVATGQEELLLEGHRAPVWAVAFDDERKQVVSADAAGTVKVWDAQGRLVNSFQGHTKGVNQLAFSPDGKRLATASLDGACKIWGPDTWQELRALPGNTKNFEAVAWSRDGELLAAGDDAQVMVWNTGTWEVLHTLPTAGKGLLEFSPDGRTLLTARCYHPDPAAHAFARWDLATGRQQATFRLPTHSGHAFFHLSPDGQTVFVSRLREDGRVRAYDAETGQERFPHEGPRGAVTAVAFSPDGRTLASGGANGTVRLWDLAAWRSGELAPPIRVLEAHTNEVWSVAFSPDGKLLASGGNDGLICLWDVAGVRKVRDLTGHSRAHAYLTFSPDGRTVVAGGRYGTVNRWDALTGRPKEPWHWHVGEVRPVAYSPDGRLLASGGKDATVQLLNAITGQQVHAFRGGAFFTNLSFSPDGRALAAVSEAPEAYLRLWDLETKSERTFPTDSSHILGLSFHPSGKYVATASLNGMVRLWDTTSPGKEVRAIDCRFGGGAYCAAFTPEGRYLVVGLQYGAIAILRAAP